MDSPASSAAFPLERSHRTIIDVNLSIARIIVFMNTRFILRPRPSAPLASSHASASSSSIMSGTERAPAAGDNHHLSHTRGDSVSSLNAASSTSTTRPFEMRDFVTVDTIGEGSYSSVREVFLANKPTERYALKIMDKSHIVREGKARYVATERALLAGRLADCDCVAALRFTFQDTYSLYLGMELCTGGDLYSQLKRSEGEVMTEEKAVFYVSEVTRAVQQCHARGIVHRDVKPENVLIDSTGHVKLCDFGSALDLQPVMTSVLTAIAEQAVKKDAKHKKNRCASFVGTAEYVAPEILEGCAETTTAVDLWSIGVMTFQLLTGRVPFKDKTEYLTMQAVLKGKYVYPPEANVSSAAKDFIDKLLVREPKKRIGFEDETSIRSHPFFASVSHWSKLRARKAPSVLTAKVCGSDATVSESESESDTDDDEEWRARVNAATAALDAL